MAGCVEGILLDLDDPNEVFVSAPTSPYHNAESPTRNLEPPKSATKGVLDDEKLNQSLLSLSIEEFRMDSSTKTSRRPLSTTSLDEVKLLEDEEFDFNLPISPASTASAASDEDDDDDEVFIGKVVFVEQVVASRVEKESELLRPPTPPATTEWAQIFVDAAAIVSQIQTDAKKLDHAESQPNDIEELVQKPIPEITVDLSPETQKMFVTKSRSDSEASESAVGGDGNRERLLERLRNVSGGSKAQSKQTRPGAQKRLFRMNQSKSPLEELAKALPRIRVPKDNAGNILFQAKSKRSGGCKSPEQKPAATRASPRLKTGTLSTGTPLKKTIARRSLQPPGNASKVAAVTKPKIKSPLKRLRIGSTSSTSSRGHDTSLDSLETASNCSDTSETELKPSGKRRLLQPPRYGSSLKPPGQTSLLKPPGQPSLLKRPGQQAQPSLPKSGLRVPNAQSTQPTLAKPAIKSSMTKLDLLKPGMGQRKTLIGCRSKMPQASSSSSIQPMKALGPVKPLSNSKMQPLKPLGPPSQAPSSPSRSVKGSSDVSTPVKKDRPSQTKQIIEAEVGTPRRNSDSNLIGTPVSNCKSSSKRRSFLPTPGRTRSSSLTSVSSHTSVESTSDTPALGVPRKPRVQHTPLNKENQEPNQQSAWSPIRRPRGAIIDGDEPFACTKRMTILKPQKLSAI